MVLGEFGMGAFWRCCRAVKEIDDHDSRDECCELHQAGRRTRRNEAKS